MMQAVSEPVPIYTQLRGMILGLSPAEIGAAQSAETPHAWGALMEMGFPQAVITLAALADGTTSLYFSNGGGILGGGGHAVVANAGRQFVRQVGECLLHMQPTGEYPLPCVGQVRFYLLAFGGIFCADCNVGELASGSHPLSGLFYAGQEVITQLRLVKETEPEG